MDSTNLEAALMDAKNVLEAGKCKHPKIFILTDGESNDDEACIEFVIALPKHYQVFVYGISSGCNEVVCNVLAELGRGECQIVEDMVGSNIQAIVAGGMTRSQNSKSAL